MLEIVYKNHLVRTENVKIVGQNYLFITMKRHVLDATSTHLK